MLCEDQVIIISLSRCLCGAAACGDSQQSERAWCARASLAHFCDPSVPPVSTQLRMSSYFWPHTSFSVQVKLESAANVIFEVPDRKAFLEAFTNPNNPFMWIALAITVLDAISVAVMFKVSR